MVNQAPVKEVLPVAQNYGAGLNMSTEASSLKEGEVQISENMRLTAKGKLRSRNGYDEKADEETDVRTEAIFTMEEIGVMFKKVGTKVYQSIDGTNWYDIGITRTAGTGEYFHAYDNFVFINNPTDGKVKIVVTLTAEEITIATTTFDVSAGEGFLLSSSGTVYAEGDEIDYGGITTDTLTTVTNVSATHKQGTVLTHTVAISTAPKGYAMSDLDSKLLVAGKNGFEEVIYYSATSSDADPTLIHDFVGNDANAKRMPSHVTALHAGGGIVLVGMKRGIRFAHSFDITTGGLLMRDITQSHGILNENSCVYVEGRFYCITNTNRIVVIVANGGAAELVEKEENGLPFDWGIRPILAAMNTNQTGAHAHFDPAKNWIYFTVISDGIMKTLVFDMNIGAWAGVDTNKPICCRAFFKGRTYGGDINDSKVYLDDEGNTDNGGIISWHVRTRAYTYDDGRAELELLEWFFSGLISSSGEFRLSMIMDNATDTPAFDLKITAKDMREAGLLETVTDDSPPRVGDPIVPDQASDALPYDYPITLKHSTRSAEFDYRNNAAGTWFSLDESRLEYQTTGEHLLTSQ